MNSPIRDAKDLPEAGNYKVELTLEPFCVVPVLAYLRDLLSRPDMQPPQADLRVTFEGLTPDQVKLLQNQLEDGFMASFTTLVDCHDVAVADVQLK